ncbi:MAG TPA: FGGY family carbohydrate kinase [Spirochaetia bacterium]|nr:FGGY family carbohydrate kinase [Spirochaetia bacterium]
MSLLGIDVGTTGCKAAAFTPRGQLLSFSYEEYDVKSPAPGRAELEPAEVWAKVVRVIRAAVDAAGHDRVQTLAVSSLGEAVVPMGAKREILGPSILNFDSRGAEYLEGLRSKLEAEELYRVSGNTLENWYSLPKLLWIRDNEPDLYARTSLFLHWGSFVPFMLGADAAIDYSLANRSLLFDMEHERWSSSIAEAAGFDVGKLPAPVPSGTVTGRVSAEAAALTGLPAGVPIVAGAHDQCSNAVGSGVVTERVAMCGMGSYLCVVPVFATRPEAKAMIARGLNTEHHAAPGRFVSFLYTRGGSLVKWFRDTFARMDRDRAAESGKDIYEVLLAEMPADPPDVVVIPRFAPMGPPDFAADAAGVIAGMTLETTRGDILRALIEGTLFHVRDMVDSIASAGVAIDEFRAVGGGSKSAAWVGMCADIFGRPVVRPRVTEAGCLGAAVIAGIGCGQFPGFSEGVRDMVSLGDRIECSPGRRDRYEERYQRYRGLWPRLKDYLHRKPDA